MKTLLSKSFFMGTIYGLPLFNHIISVFYLMVHIHTIQHESERLKGLMIGVDARNAFDSVDHNYMQGVLEAYDKTLSHEGFGNFFPLVPMQS